MNRPAIVDILNELLAYEQRNLVTALQESTLFVSRLSMDDVQMVENLAESGRQNAAWLAETIHRLGGVPGLRRIDPSAADLHYQELRHARPRLLADREAMVARYEAAADKVGDEPAGAEVTSRILRRHRDELASLQDKLSNPDH